MSGENIGIKIKIIDLQSLYKHYLYFTLLFRPFHYCVCMSFLLANPRNFTAATNQCCSNNKNLASNTEEFPNILLTLKHTIHYHWNVAAYGQGTWQIFVNI